MGFFSSNKNTEKIVAIFDIGSGSVGGALVKISSPNENGIVHPPVILSQSHAPIPFQESIDFELFFADMQKALFTVANELYLTKVGAPQEIICNLASPWYVGETRHVHITKNAPFLVTKEMIHELVTTELASLAETYKKKYESTGAESQLMESKVFHTRLNGYLVDDPIGKRASSLDVYLFLALSPKICLDNIRETFVRVFHHTPVSFTSFISSLCIGSAERFTPTDSYLLIDIRGEITDIAIVSGGVLVSTVSFPFGKHGIIRAFKKQGMDEREARSVIAMKTSNVLSDNRAKELEPSIAEIQKSWNDMFTASVAQLPRTIALPSMIFLVADTDTALWFREVIAEAGAVSGHQFTVTTLGGQLFLNICKVADGTCDPFLMIEAIAATRMHALK